MDHSRNKKARIIMNEDQPVERPGLVDAYGVEIGPEEELYIPCLDGTDPVPPRSRILGVSKE
jgi:arsenate reductase-like glutaredoxin family protein